MERITPHLHEPAYFVTVGTMFSRTELLVAALTRKSVMTGNDIQEQAPTLWQRKLRAFCMWLLCILAILFAGAAMAEPADSHSWKQILYPPISGQGFSGSFILLVESDFLPGLTFSVTEGTSRGTSPGHRDGKPLVPADKVRVRLHLSDGKMVSPVGGDQKDWKIGNELEVQRRLFFAFPWGENKLEEGWIELRLADQTYWIELPYGFTRKPAAPRLDDAEHGVPEFPPTMKDLPAKDVLVPWLAVDYDLGAIQNQWRLSLHLSNPFRARAETILDHENVRWDLHAPRTAMEIQWPGGRSEGRCVGIRITDVFRRTDDYLFRGGPDPEKGRIWGKAVVKVDDKSYECAVPSSLFKFTHGATDPYHKQRLARPKPPDGDF